MMRTKFDYRALGRLPAGQMNKTEAAYASHLELLKASGDILWWKFEPANLRLAPKTFYCCDFMALNRDQQLEMHEVKGGYITDDANVKIKVAASMYPFAFFIIRKKGHFWTKTPIQPTEDEEAA